jgi:recombinational DNA repair ATPase RecF
VRITSLKIERFGVWEGLSLPKVSRGVNVFYGPNEAGKTTLMQFIRACLYGGADEERARYIQMALDGKTRRGEKAGFGEKRFDRCHGQQFFR